MPKPMFRYVLRRLSPWWARLGRFGVTGLARKVMGL
jgi:hypothetical protein